ncbi:glycerophosphodiester phosphodiesterase family protein [Arenivirga flava]|uniref:glycerophosphodiester phosphodiesterase family protein n=1 Tax=Arenivirga flava TaxID=1930060 RepID=UPI0024E0742D|nr:glycerophosphodiester phosphodiesterase family protein [Arenivirga flava]
MNAPRPLGRNPHPLVIAHRGASGHRVEHSRAAYELGIAQGADAVEPDLVPTRDGVLVVRHENEISGTTDVAERPEFAHRRRSRTVDGKRLDGWFTEDFTWAELQGLRLRERLPKLRPSNDVRATGGGMLRFVDLLDLLEAADRPVRLIAEIKHAAHFEAAGFPMHELLLAELGSRLDGLVTVESFEQTVLRQLRASGFGGRTVLLAEASGAPADLVARHGSTAPDYASFLTDEGLAAIAAEEHGVSVDKTLLLGRSDTTDLVDRAHAAGLEVYAWTLRPENAFLAPRHRGPGGRAAHGDWRAEFRAVLATGLDGVFADHPDLALAVRAGLA